MRDVVISQRGRRGSDRGAYSRFQRAVAEAELTRFIKADDQAERFTYQLDESAISHAETFDGKLVLLTNVDDFSAADIVTRYKSLADIERGFRVLRSDLEIAPVHHRSLTQPFAKGIRRHPRLTALAIAAWEEGMRELETSRVQRIDTETEFASRGRVHRDEAGAAELRQSLMVARYCEHLCGQGTVGGRDPLADAIELGDQQVALPSEHSVGESAVSLVDPVGAICVERADLVSAIPSTF